VHLYTIEYRQKAIIYYQFYPHNSGLNGLFYGKVSYYRIQKYERRIKYMTIIHAYGLCNKI